MSIRLERAYDEDRLEGTRVLVGRIWPRGVSKDELGLDRWSKGIAPLATSCESSSVTIPNGGQRWTT